MKGDDWRWWVLVVESVFETTFEKIEKFDVENIKWLMIDMGFIGIKIDFEKIIFFKKSP